MRGGSLPFTLLSLGGLALLCGVGCGEDRLSEIPESTVCGPLVSQVVGGPQPIELGQIEGGVFLPLNGSEVFELHYTPASAGWSVAMALRFVDQNPAFPYLESCANAQSGTEAPSAALMRPAGASLVSAEPVAIALPGELDALLLQGSATVTVNVKLYTKETNPAADVAASAGPVTIRLKNDDGLFAEP